MRGTFFLVAPILAPSSLVAAQEPILPLGALGVGLVLAVLPSGEDAQDEGASLRLGPGSITWRGSF
jgi:hypothetical protein